MPNNLPNSNRAHTSLRYTAQTTTGTVSVSGTAPVWDDVVPVPRFVSSGQTEEATLSEEQIREILERASGIKKKKEPFKPEVLKQRHLTKDERLALHKPKPDWVLTGGGEVCRSTCVLEVDDLLSLIKTD